jgi:hypothetical protein
MKKIGPYLLFVVLFAGCRDKFELPLRETDVSRLVVEGVLTAGQAPTTISLSRTVNVNDTARIKPVSLAKLTVEGKDGSNFNLNETGNGIYMHPGLPLVIGQEYRLRIHTSDNREYLSDYTLARQTPPIDSISWKGDNQGVVIYANSHDPANDTRYYKWDFDETWEIQSYYPATYKWTGGTSIVYSPDYHVICWKYDQSTNIIIGSTAQLQSDVVSEAPLRKIPFGSDRLSVRYSMLLRQQSLTKEAYQYLSIMKNNTESIGSIFGPLPAELRGNIKCVSNPEESVVGYVTASSFAEKRIFITRAEANWKFSQDCPYVTVPNIPDSLKLFLGSYLPFASAEERFGMVISYNLAHAPCVDCVLRGGDLNKPSYW